MRTSLISAALALSLWACGGGGDGKPLDSSSGATPAPEPAPAPTPTPATTAGLSAKALPDHKIRLTLSGVGSQASRYCIRQGTVQPLAGDSCFTDSDSTLLVQDKALTPSDTERVIFTAWLLTGSVVSHHASVSAPGKTCSAGAYNAIASSTLPAVCIITSSGESVLLLESAKAPITVANFLRYVNQGFYDQTVFHRFWKGDLNFVQGGGYTYDASQTGANKYVDKVSTLPAIVLESPVSTGLSNTAGTIAMARTDDPDSATSGFFVNTDTNRGFDSTTTRNGYAVFGHIVYGQNSWTTLLNSAVASTGEVTEPSTPVHHLRWAYQIQ